jgi:Secretion system C-terminal sorting domain
MQTNLKKISRVLKAALVAGPLCMGLNSFAQRPAVMADVNLGALKITDEYGIVPDSNLVPVNRAMLLQIPVLSDNHGKAIPAGSAKIKIGLGSKLELDPTFNLNTAALNSAFRWTSEVSGGQVMITGELINDLPASVTGATVVFRVKATETGRSTVTANFLITNHNTAVILSDENGSNNAVSLAYKTAPGAAAPAGEPAQLVMYPNPVTDKAQVTIEAKQGRFDGYYAIAIVDVNGKTVQAGRLALNGVSRFNYNLVNLAAGAYVLQLKNAAGTTALMVKFEKL